MSNTTNIAPSCRTPLKSTIHCARNLRKVIVSPNLQRRSITLRKYQDFAHARCTRKLSTCDSFCSGVAGIAALIEDELFTKCFHLGARRDRHLGGGKEQSLPWYPVILRCPRVFVACNSRVRSARDGDRTDDEAIHRGTDHWLPA